MTEEIAVRSNWTKIPKKILKDADVLNVKLELTKYQQTYTGKTIVVESFVETDQHLLVPRVYAQKLVDNVQDSTSYPHLKWPEITFPEGSAYREGQEKAIEETLVKDILWVSLCIAVFFGLFIFHTYRTISAFVFAIVMMGSSIWMTFCLYPLFGYQITVITILALPIILVLSLSDAIHLLS